MYSLYVVETIQAGVLLFETYASFASGRIKPFSNPYLIGVSATLFPLLGACRLLSIDVMISLNKASFDDHPGAVYVPNLRLVAQPLAGGYHRIGVFLSRLKVVQSVTSAFAC